MKRWVQKGSIFLKTVDFIQNKKCKKFQLFKSKSIFFPIRYPKDNDFKEGCLQRVLAIDKILSQKNITRIYVAKSEKFSFLPRIIFLQEDIFEIKASEKNFLHLFYLLYIAIKSDCIYLHSIMRIKTPIHFLMFLFSKTKIIDLHGAVPEELLLQGKKLRSRIFEKVERFTLKKADLIISVSDSMTEYIKNKHNLKNKKFIQLPIFSLKSNNLVRKEYSKKVIYCGGLQKWQKVEKMLAYVNKFKNDFEFVFLVPDPIGLKNKYTEIYKDNFHGIVRSSSPEEVFEWYKKNNFGLVLRDNIVVNRVACPTKLIEYLQNDIVPIVDSPDIGDFKKMGYRYVNLNERLPNKEVWNKMILDNRKVLKKMSSISKKGERMLIKFLDV